MNVLDSRVYRWLEVFTNFLILDLIWLVSCLPVVTIYPATAAMFGVTRDWVRKGDTEILGPFVERFRENFKQSFGIGLLWTLIGLGLGLDLYLVVQMAPLPKTVFGSLLAIMLLLYTFTSLYLFPVMVHYDAGWQRVLKNSFLLSISQLGTTMRCLLVLAVAAAISYVVPLTLVLTGSVTAYLIYYYCNRAFERVEAVAKK